jgi:aqualysin 1
VTLSGILNHPRGHFGRIIAGLGVTALVAAVSTAPASAAQGSAAASSKPAPLIGTSTAGVIPGQYLVMLKDQAGPHPAGLHGAPTSTMVSAAVRRAKRAGATVQDQYTHAVQGYAAELSPAALAQVRADPTVAYVQANQAYHSTATENDAVWGIDRIDQRDLPLTGRYYYTGNGAGVTAYVVDTGVRGTHADFSTDAAGNVVLSRVSQGVDEIGGGLESCDPNDETQFDAGHGTHVAGILGGVFYGVAKAVNLVSVRVLDCTGGSSSATVAQGLDWIVGNHASGPAVANLSLSNDGSGPDTVVEAAVIRLIADNVTVVIAAGNGDQNGNGTSACSFSPGNVSAAITVGSSTKTDQRSSFSNYGSCVDLYAPGSDIESDWSSSDRATMVLSGTSMATPHVAGAVAIYLQQHPTATPATVQAAIVGAATPNKVTNVSSAWPRRLLFALQKVTPPPATSTAGQIPSGQALLLGKQICSPNTLYCLQQRTSDGKLVLSKPGSRVLWSNTGGAAAWTRMSVSGNLASYDVYNRLTWSSGTTGAGISSLRVQDNGRLAIIKDADGGIAWVSNKAQITAPPQTKSSVSTLVAGKALYRGSAKLVSPNGKFSFALRANGDLVLAKKSVGTIWHTGAKDDDWLSLGGTGNLVLYRSDGRVVWKTGTGGQGAARLILQNTGNLVLARISDNKTLWSTKTSGS